MQKIVEEYIRVELIKPKNFIKTKCNKIKFHLIIL